MSWSYALLMMMIVVEPSGLICVCVNLAGAAVTAGEAATKPTKARVAATVEKRMVVVREGCEWKIEVGARDECEEWPVQSQLLYSGQTQSMQRSD
jgi:hypothetical protein